MVFTEVSVAGDAVSVRDLSSGEVTQEIEFGPDGACGDESRLLDVGSGAGYLKQQAKDKEDEDLEVVDLESGDVLWERDPEGSGDLVGIHTAHTVPQVGMP